MGFSEGTPAGDYREYVGALHVHTRHSDGRASMQQVLKAAEATGVDFVLISDHDSLGAKIEGWEGWHQGILVLVGVEISPRRRGHCLAWGVKECSEYREMNPGEYLRCIALQGGAAFAAHPEGKLRPYAPRRVQRWTEWEHAELAGMEIWSFLHDWSEGIWPWGVHQVPLRLIEPTRWLKGPLPETLRQWDRMGRQRRFVGIGGLDAHEFGLSFIPWRLMSHYRVFRTIRTHVRARRLSGEKEHDLRAVREAVEEGRCHVANDFVCDSTGFDFWGRSKDGGPVLMGQEVAFGGDLELHVHCAVEGELALLRDGVQRETKTGCDMVAEVSEPGVYRVEARMDGKPWIFSNPIYVRGVER